MGFDAQVRQELLKVHEELERIKAVHAELTQKLRESCSHDIVHEQNRYAGVASHGDTRLCLVCGAEKTMKGSYGEFDEFGTVRSRKTTHNPWHVPQELRTLKPLQEVTVLAPEGMGTLLTSM